MQIVIDSSESGDNGTFLRSARRANHHIARPVTTAPHPSTPRAPAVHSRPELGHDTAAMIKAETGPAFGAYFIVVTSSSAAFHRETAVRIPLVPRKSCDDYHIAVDLFHFFTGEPR